MRIVRTLASLILSLGVTASAVALPVNLSFESGNLSGWTVSNPLAIGEFTGLTPVGSASVLPLFQFGGAPGPIDGSFMAAVGTGNASLLPGQGAFDITVQQSFSLDAGSTLSGNSFFYNGDFAAQDSVWVRILDGGGNILATPWIQVSGTGGVTPFQGASPWTSWAWSAPTTGSYTLVLGASTFGDDRFATFGFHDGIRVPEPSSLILLTAGIGALVMRARGRRVNKT